MHLTFFQKNGRYTEKLKRVLQPNELAAAMNNLSQDQRYDYLQKTFEEITDEYRKVIERVGASVES